MTINNWLEQATEKIARREAEWLLAQRLGVDRSFLVTHGDNELNKMPRLESDIRRREAGEPLDLILDEKEFYGRKFSLGSGAVLIPRPESEMIVEICKELQPKEVLDIGTGSGCLAVSVALEVPEAKAIAADIDQSALAVARENARRLGAEIEFCQMDLLGDWQEELPEVIVANLPYVDEDWEWLDKKALSYEPRRALFAERGGLALIEKLIDQIVARRGGKWLLLEADPCQHSEIKQYAEARGLKHWQTRGYILQFELV